MSKSNSTALLAIALALFLTGSAHAFGISKNELVMQTHQARRVPLFMVDNDDGDQLTKLGFSDDEIRRSKKEPETPPVRVNVNLIDDVDPLTLTAIGFGLIAMNFFVFANMGDGGVGGIIATIMNSQ
jgi:hypothetical protein